MLKNLKRLWREFKDDPPGHRFQDRYERNREGRSAQSASRFLKPVVAVLLIVAGIVFCLIPGPGLPLLLIGAALLADISLPVARALDAMELRLRDLLSRFRHWWSGASPIV